MTFLCPDFKVREHLDLPLSIHLKNCDKGGKVGASVFCGYCSSLKIDIWDTLSLLFIHQIGITGVKVDMSVRLVETNFGKN